MSQEKNVTVNGGIGVFGLLGVLFVALKLLGVIDWSWWWVTLPFWGGAALVATVVIVLLILGFIAWLIERHEERARRGTPRA